MDTSTRTFTDELPPLHRTISHSPERVEPAPWHTRLLSPNTKLDSADTSSAVLKTGKLRPQRLNMLEVDQRPNGHSWDVSQHGDSFAAIGGEKTMDYGEPNDGPSTVLIVFIPILVVILTVLLGVLIFLIALLCMKRQRGIRLTEDGGPLDLSKGDGVMGEGGTEGVESRWLETVDPDVKEAYKRAKGKLICNVYADDQTGKCNIPLRLCPPTSLCRSSCRFRRREWQLGHLNRIMRRTCRCTSSQGLRSPSCPMVLVCQPAKAVATRSWPICRYRRSTRFTTGRSRCTTSQQLLKWRLDLRPNLIRHSGFPAGTASL